GVGTGEHKWTPFFKRLWGLIQVFKPRTEIVDENKDAADGYHGKVVPFEQAKQLVSIKKPIEIRNLEKILPYERAKDIVMKNPDHIAVLECPCRAARKNPCKPLDVCIIVGEPFVSFILEHHPEKARKITSDEAIRIIREEDERGHVHHAFFKDAMLQRFYAICNCCSCCCGAMQAMRNGIPMLAPSGYILKIDQEQCKGCGECIEYCQFEALSMVDGKAQVDEEACMGCGVCVEKCKRHAHELILDSRRGEPLEIEKLMEQVVS
ncbi:MAG: 4Fe-4S ferredoxin, partial [Calditrichaeota bacterium]